MPKVRAKTFNVERNRFVKNKRKYWFQYSMALAGAKIYLRA
jgi:hypothetical protein